MKKQVPSFQKFNFDDIDFEPNRQNIFGTVLAFPDGDGAGDWKWYYTRPIRGVGAAAADNDDQAPAPDLTWQRRPLRMTCVESQYSDGQPSDWTWHEWRERRLSEHKVHAKGKDGFLPVTLRDYRPGAEMFPNEVGEGKRPKNIRNANISDVHAFVFDIDGGQPYEDATRALMAAGVAFMGHSSYSNGMLDDAGNPKVKFRVIVPVAAPVAIDDTCTPGTFRDSYKALGAAMGILFDQACSNIGRVFYLPANDGSERARAAAFVDWSCWDRPALDATPYIEEALRAREAREAKRAPEPEDSPKIAAPLEAAIRKHIQAIDPRTLLELAGETCPNWEEHSNKKKDEPALYCFAAGEMHQEGEPWRYPWLKCRHLHCKEITPAEMMIRIAARDGLTADDFAECIEDDAVRAAFKAHARGMPGDFFIEAGKIRKLVESDGEEYPIDVIRAYEPIGRIRDEHDGSWGHELKFVTETGVVKSCVIRDGDATGDMATVRRQLADAGLMPAPGRTAHEALARLLYAYKSERHVVMTSKPGFYVVDGRTIFITPAGDVIGDQRGEVWRLAPNAGMTHCARGGSLEGWRESVGDQIWHPNLPHFALGLMAGCAGPILQLAGLDSTGVFLIGPSSRGKSISQKIQAGVWGSPKPGAGLLIQARGTANAFEFSLARGNGSTLAVDEAKNADPRAITQLTFQLAGGTGKRRMSANLTERRVSEWITFATLSSETDMSAYAREVGTTLVTGGDVRMPTVDVSELVPIDPSAAQAIAAGAADHFGHIGPVFIDALFQLGFVDDPAKLRARIEHYRVQLAGADSPAAARAAQAFAVLLVAGEVLESAGLVPASVDFGAPVDWAWRQFMDSESARRLDTAADGVEALIHWCQTNPAAVRRTHDHAPHGSQPILAWFDDACVYLPSRSVEKIPLPTTWKALRGELKRQGKLITANGRNWTHDRIPGLNGKTPHYRIDVRLRAESADSHTESIVDAGKETARRLKAARG